ncbi:hypothetical protein CROQUDRAFT_108694 [Cronartium quercuum f. sp. fusiforme G11]|uniref:Uncharacterized protein n=1 Tax=Cronartium quercuum f. sp. fusiforme G11 TaxID=708437 RepID=A0A9P6NDG4_9BASI|nr:hypothetical protein CROQUDRAFT_108694 [Cronartium quercuum f. sp. fusiforme G11]
MNVLNRKNCLNISRGPNLAEFRQHSYRTHRIDTYPTQKRQSSPIGERPNPIEETFEMSEQRGVAKKPKSVWLSPSAVESEDEDKDMITAVDRRTDNIYKFINHVRKLEQDGSNIVRWKEQTANTIFIITGVTDYWKCAKPRRDSKWAMAVDRCGYRVICNTIPEDIISLVNGTTLAHDAMSKIEDQFKFGGRTAQITTFRTLLNTKFDPHTTSVMEYANEIEKYLDRLESEGVVWTRDCLMGLFLQLGAPTSGVYAMDDVNLALDRKYRDDPSPFSARQIETEMQSFFTNKRIALNVDTAVNVMAATTIADRRAPTNGYQSNPNIRMGQPAQSQSRGGLTPMMTERDASEINPISVPPGAAPEVKRDENQCFQCGGFGHVRTYCQHKVKIAPDGSERTPNTPPLSLDLGADNLSSLTIDRPLGDPERLPNIPPTSETNVTSIKKKKKKKKVKKKPSVRNIILSSEGGWLECDPTQPASPNINPSLSTHTSDFNSYNTTPIQSHPQYTNSRQVYLCNYLLKKHPNYILLKMNQQGILLGKNRNQDFYTQDALCFDPDGELIFRRKNGEMFDYLSVFDY